MRFITFILLLSFFQVQSVKAKPEYGIPYADSLVNELNIAEHDTTRAYLMLAVGEAIYLKHLDSALMYWNEALKLTTERIVESEGILLTTYLKRKSSSLNNLGAIAIKTGKNSEALKYFTQCVEIHEQVDDKDGLSSTLNNIGYVYKSRGDDESALRYYLESLGIRESVNDLYGIANSYNNISAIYFGQKDYDSALEYGQKSLAIRKEIGDKQGIALGLNNIGFMYKKSGDFEAAKEAYLESLQVQEEVGDQRVMAQTTLNLGLIYKLLGSWEDAFPYYKRSLKIRQGIGDQAGISQSLNNLANIYLNNKHDNDSALLLSHQALEIAQEYQLADEIKFASGLLSKIYEADNQYENALNYEKRYVKMKDSLLNADKSKEIGKMEATYEMEKKILDNKRLEEAASAIAEATESRRNNLQYSGILIFMVLLGVGLVGLGRVSISPRLAEGMIFFTFLLFFEFMLVMLDPYIELYSSGAPALKLAFNAALAGLIFPLHSFFETKLKSRIIKKP